MEKLEGNICHTLYIFRKCGSWRAPASATQPLILLITLPRQPIQHTLDHRHGDLQPPSRGETASYLPHSVLQTWPDGALSVRYWHAGVLYRPLALVARSGHSLGLVVQSPCEYPCLSPLSPEACTCCLRPHTKPLR